MYNRTVIKSSRIEASTDSTVMRVAVGEIFQTPGPGAYSPEKVPPLGHRRPPVYTISTRTRYRTVDPVPAPNR